MCPVIWLNMPELSEKRGSNACGIGVALGTTFFPENGPLIQHDEPIETLYCALLFLLARRACAFPPELATMITEHLKWLADHPDAEDLPVLRKTCQRLAMHWQSRSGTARRRRSDLH